MKSRRTEIKLLFEGVDITEDINEYFQTLSYTDNESDEADDLQLAIDDRDHVWIGDWLNQTNADLGVGKGAELEAVIIQKNFFSNGKDKVLECGLFQVDDVSYKGNPNNVTLKATSIPATSTLKTQKKTKGWEQFKLSTIASEIASSNGMVLLYESKADPLYKRVEQMSESDICFLQRLCKNRGISLKVTAKMIVLFDAAEYEQKSAVRSIIRGTDDVLSASLGTKIVDTAYSECRVQYTDPDTQQTFEGAYTCPTTGTGQVLEINEAVSSNGEALELAQMRLREKNKNEFSASFTLVGDADLVAGLTVNVGGYGAFDGKYIIETATHSVSGSGYTTGLKLRRVLEGY